jgi:hypothetical protein
VGSLERVYILEARENGIEMNRVATVLPPPFDWFVSLAKVD